MKTDLTLNKTDETMTNTYHLQLIIKALKEAIENEDKAEISRLYDEAKTIDLDKVSYSTFEEYDALVDQANDILMQEAA
ncbi:hypothetical protein [Gracilimonas tropica]|uniref:hypothetical protein n=1 Tax=Gracilimonas tropica TaxID=454600 RepID=UPI00035E1BD9|nr:hypothetical protein [Gracilimonas tropica]